MQRRSIVYSVLLGCIFAALLAGPATAAGPRPRAERVEPPVGFELEGDNGYTIVGYGFIGDAREPAGFVLGATRGDETAMYTTQAKVTPTSIRADLGRLGRVDLVLRTSGQKATTHVKCYPGPVTYEEGTWEGLIEFNGEAGYTRVRVTQAAALPYLVLLADGPDCGHSFGESSGRGLPGARLKGVSYAGGRTIKFQINKNSRRGKARFTASLAERDGGIRIYREANGLAPANAFRYDRRLRTATLGPPAPFSGSAHLRRTRDAVSPLWSGNLTFAFPGRTVPLAGPAYHVSLAHARRTEGNDGSITVGI